MSRKQFVESVGIPIVGIRLTWFVCVRGHADELPAPMVYLMPPVPGSGSEPLKVTICRICMMEFLAGMVARPANEEELAQIKQQESAQEASNAKESA